MSNQEIHQIFDSKLSQILAGNSFKFLNRKNDLPEIVDR
jgi:hypothetical protein